MKFKTLFAGTLVALGFSLVGATEAIAASLTSVRATVTADNFYALFHGDKDGNFLSESVGRNETGDAGSPGRYNWSEAETSEFQMELADYLYVVVWDDGRVAETWIGDFDIGGTQLLTKEQDWEFKKGDYNPYLDNSRDPENEVPTNVAAIIGNGEAWGDVTQIGKNGSGVWGNILRRERGLRNGTTSDGAFTGIDENAYLLETTGHSDGQYTIFRTKKSIGETVGLPPEPQSVPEPASVLAILGVAACGTMSLKKQQKQAKKAIV